MSNGDVSQGRRRFLIGATSVVGGVGVVGAAVPFVASWNPSAKAEGAVPAHRGHPSREQEGVNQCDESLHAQGKYEDQIRDDWALASPDCQSNSSP